MQTDLTTQIRLNWTGSISFNAEKFLRHLYVETEIHTVFILDCFYRSPSLPAAADSSGGHMSIIARGSPRNGHPAADRQTFSFLARFAKYLANLSIPSWNAGRRRSYEILDFHRHAMSDPLRCTNPRIEIIKNGPTQNQLTPLIPQDVLDQFLKTGEVCPVDNDKHDESGASTGIAQDIVKDVKEYTGVHVLIIKWQESHFPSDADLEVSLKLLAKSCHRLYWEPERLYIQGHSDLECERHLSSAINEFTSSYGNDPTNLLILVYVGHGHLDSQGQWVWAG